MKNRHFVAAISAFSPIVLPSPKPSRSPVVPQRPASHRRRKGLPKTVRFRIEDKDTGRIAIFDKAAIEEIEVAGPDPVPASPLLSLNKRRERKRNSVSPSSGVDSMSPLVTDLKPLKLCTLLDPSILPTSSTDSPLSFDDFKLLSSLPLCNSDSLESATPPDVDETPVSHSLLTDHDLSSTGSKIVVFESSLPSQSETLISAGMYHLLTVCTFLLDK